MEYFDTEFPGSPKANRENWYVDEYAKGITVGQLRALHTMIEQGALDMDDGNIRSFWPAIDDQSTAAPQPAPLTSREGRTGVVNEADKKPWRDPEQPDWFNDLSETQKKDFCNKHRPAGEEAKGDAETIVEAYEQWLFENDGSPLSKQERALALCLIEWIQPTMKGNQNAP